MGTNINGLGKVITTAQTAVAETQLKKLETQLGDANAALRAAPLDWSPASKKTRADLTASRDAIQGQINQLKGSAGSTAPQGQVIRTSSGPPPVDPKVATESRILSQLRTLPAPYNGGSDPAKLGAALYDRTLGRVGTDEQFVNQALELAHNNGTTAQVNEAVGQRLRADYPGIDQRPEIKSNPKDGYVRFLISKEMGGSEGQRALDYLTKGADQNSSSNTAYVGEGMQKMFDQIGDGLHDNPLKTGAIVGGAVVAGVAVAVAAPVVAAAAGVGFLAYGAGKVVKNTYESATAKTDAERAQNLVELGGAVSETALASIGARASVNTLGAAASAASKAETAGQAAWAFAKHGSRFAGQVTSQQTVALADKVHADWQATARASGRTEKFKPAKVDGAQVEIQNQADLGKLLDSRGIPKELQGHYRLVNGKLEEDIVNLPNRYLFPNNAGENNKSAEVVSKLINEQLGRGGKLDDPKFIQAASDKVHVEWMARNKDWAPKEQMLPYNQLSPAEAQKDTDMVLLGIKMFKGG